MTSPQDQPRMRAGDADRDAILTVLQQAHASGRLTLDEFDERQSQALTATHTDQLRGLIADLPEASDHGPGHAAGPVVRRPGHEVVPGSKPSVQAISIMSGRTIRPEAGVDTINGLALMGGDDLHLGDLFAPGVTVTVNLSAVMGGCDLYVPEGVRVVDESIAIMAGNDIKREAMGDGSNGTLVLRGLLFWGGHDVRLER